VRRLSDVTAQRLAFAESVLARPPRESWVKRPVLRGDRVAVFHLPLDLCPTRNAGRREHWSARKRLRDRVLAHLRMQGCAALRSQRDGQARAVLPLAGRSQLVAIRFSSVPVDADAGFAKTAIDCLTPNAGGIGLIEDDSPRHVERCEWWEYAPRGKGFVLLEVRT